MRNKTRSEKDPTTQVGGRVPWVVTAVRVLPDYRIYVWFRDGTEGEVDLAGFIFAEDAGVFIPLRDPAKFAEAYVHNGAVTWPGELDLAPDAMYDDIRAGGR